MSNNKEKERKRRKARSAKERRERMAPLIEIIMSGVTDHLDGSYLLRKIKQRRNELAEEAKVKFSEGMAVTWLDGFGTPRVGIVSRSSSKRIGQNNTRVDIRVMETATGEVYQIDPGDLTTAAAMDSEIIRD